MPQQNSYSSALYTLITIFFFWSFIAASNGIFISFCMNQFNLSQFESQLVDLTFYGGWYFIGSLAFYYASQIFQVDILNKIGFKNGIIYGLVISSLGALSMLPAFNSGSFSFILISFFLIAICFSLQKTAANLFAVALGTPETGADRLNLSGGLNNFGSNLGPIIMSVVLLGSAAGAAPKTVEISSINNLCYIVARMIIAVVIFFAISKLPKVNSDEEIEASHKTNDSLFVLFVSFVMILISDILANSTGSTKAIFVYLALAIIVLTLFFASRSASNSRRLGRYEIYSTGFRDVGYFQLS